MRVAVLLTGHVRSHGETHANLRKHLLDLYDCDVFCSTWASNGLVNAKEATLLSDLYGEKLKKIHIEDPRIYNEGKMVYKRTGHQDGEVYSPEKREEAERTGRLFYLKPGVHLSNGIWWVNRLSDQFHLVKRGFNLIRGAASDETPYDVVVRVRFDASFSQPLRLSAETLTVPYFFGEYTRNEGGIRYHITDHFAYGGMEDMGEYCNLHSCMKDLYENFDIDISFAESMMYDYLLRYCKIPVRVQNFKYEIERPSEDFKSFDVRNTIDAFPHGPN